MHFCKAIIVMFVILLYHPVMAGDINIGMGHDSFTLPDSLAGMPSVSFYKNAYDSLGIDEEKALSLPTRPDCPVNQFNPNKRIDFLYEPEYIGSALWGRCKDVQVQDNIAYCTFGAGIVILNVTDPSDPILLSKLFTQSSPEQITIYQDYAYVACGVYGSAMLIVDISDPYKPEIVGRYGEDFAAWKIVLDTANVPMMAIVCAGDHGFHFVDVSDPTNPHGISYYYLWNAKDAIIVGDTAFVVGWSSNYFVALDVTDYENYYGFNYISLATHSMKMAKKGDYIYVVEEDFFEEPSQIQIIDVSDVYNLTVVGTYIFDPLYHPNDIELFGDTIAVGMIHHSECQFFDISTLDTIKYIGFVGIENEPRNIDIIGNFMYTAGDETGFHIADISNIGEGIPSIIGGYLNNCGSFEYGADWNCESGWIDFRFAIKGDTAYVSNCGSTNPVDISDPYNPFEYGCEASTYGYALDAVGDFVFAAHAHGNIWYAAHAVDVSYPTNPVTTSYLACPGKTWEMKVKDDYAYIAADTAGLQVADVKDPYDMFIVGYYNEIYGDDDHKAGTVTLHGNYAFVGDSWGMRVFDLSDPVHPAKIGDYDTEFGQGVRKVEIRDTLAFIVLAGNYDDATFEVVNIKDIGNITHVSYFLDETIPGDPWDIALAGDFAFIANGGIIGWGLLMCDISDLQDIKFVGKYDFPCDGVYCVMVKDRLVHITDYYGLFILDPHYPPPCGDMTTDDKINLIDIVYYISYLYKDGSPPEYMEKSDVNGDGKQDLLDIVYLIGYLYKSGPAPVCQ